MELETTDYGFRFMGIRNVGEKGIYVRGYHFVMPFHQLRPRQAWYRGQPEDSHVSGHMWVPMDDENCMIYNFTTALMTSQSLRTIGCRWNGDTEGG